MGAYREIVYGMLLFLSACIGAAIAAHFAYIVGGSDFPELAPEVAVRAAPYGAAFGSIAWLIFRYTCLKSPRHST